MNWIEHVCVFLSVILLFFIMWRLFSEPIQTWLSPSSAFLPVTVAVDKDGGIVTTPTTTPTTSLVIDSSDMEYYRNKNPDVIHQYHARKTEYEPVRQETAPTTINDQAAEDIELDAILLHQIVRDISADSQSVHDSHVQNTVKHLYQNLPKASTSTPLYALATEIVQFAKQSDISHEKVDDVNFIVQQILDRNATVHTVGNDREGDVLAKVWTSGNAAVKRQVLNELVDCKDTAVSLWNAGAPSIYCPTGVVTRLLNATSIENPDKMPRTTQVLRDEMLQTAAKVRKDCEADPAYHQTSSGEQHEWFKGKLVSAYERQYDGVISMDRVKEEMNAWIDAV
jgi:hypothetical protein